MKKFRCIRILALTLSLFFGFQAIAAKEDQLDEGLVTLYEFNQIRNEVFPQLPELSDEEVKSVIEFSEDLKKKMVKHKDLFQDRDIKILQGFIDDLKTSNFVSSEMQKCKTDPQYDLTKNDLAAFTDIGLLGQNKETRCRMSQKEVYSFPELEPIKDIGIHLAQRQMATEIHNAALKDNINLYFKMLADYGKEKGSLAKITEELCGKVRNGASKGCTPEHKEQITKAYESLDIKNSYSGLSQEDKTVVMTNLNDDIDKLNKKLRELKKNIKKNDDLLTIGGNDYKLSCKDPNSKDQQLYREYQELVEKMLNPNIESKGSLGRLQSELAMTMLYDQIEKPAVPETECGEDGFQEITIDKVHHKYVSIEDLDDGAKSIVKNAKNSVTQEINDFDKASDPIDYIGEKANFTPHLVGNFLAKNPEYIQYTCDGFLDYESDERIKKNIHTGVNVLVAATAFTGIGGLGMVALRAAMWGGFKVAGREGIRRISRTGAGRFFKRNSFRLLNSKGALLTYGAVTAGEVATLQELRRRKKEDVRKLETEILKMPESKAKEKLFKEYNKAAELDFDTYLAAGLGVFDVTAALSVVKLNKTINESQANELTNQLKTQRTELDKIMNDESHDPLASMRLLLPEDEYATLVKDFNKLSDKEKKTFLHSLKLNIAASDGDFLGSLRETIDQMKVSVKVPNGKELNRRILDELSPTDRLSLKLEYSKKYKDVIDDLNLDSPFENDDLVSIIYLLEKNEKFGSKNLPLTAKKNKVKEKLDELLASNQCKK